MPRFSAGSSSTVTTPPVGSYMGAWGLRKGRSVGVHDDLKARALVLDDGKERLAIVALDILFINGDMTAEIRKRVRALTGIKESNIMLNASHTHTSPQVPGGGWAPQGGSEYLRVYPEYVAGTVEAADKLIQPALVSSASAELTGVTVNRRHPEQRADTRLNVMKVSTPSGKAIAHVINFPCHAVAVGGQYLTWTADFPGVTCSFVESAAKGSVCLYVNGAAGDVHPWDLWFGNEHVKHQQTYEEAERLGDVLAAESIRLIEASARAPKAVELRAKKKPLKLRRRKAPTEDEAQAVLDGILKRYKPWNRPTWGEGDNVGNMHKRHPDPYMITNAQNLVNWAKEHNDTISTEVQGFGVGDSTMVTIGGELFSDLGIEIRNGTKAKQTWIMGYANDRIGYIPSIEAFEECEKLGYEEMFGLKYTYGATPPMSTIGKPGILKLVASAIEMADEISS